MILLKQICNKIIPRNRKYNTGYLYSYHYSCITLLFTFIILNNYIEFVQPCRWAIYFGKKRMNAAGLFTDPDHGLVEQSYLPPFLPGIEQAGKYDRNHGINRDGWGIATYNKENKVILKKSFESATLRNNNVNPELKQVARSLKSRVIFGHIRAATDGNGEKKTEMNSHPFSWHGLTWMHNGGIHNFEKTKPRLLKMLRPEIKALIQGDTDSEHSFALFTNFLRGVPTRNVKEDPFTLVELQDAMEETLRELEGVDHDKHRIELGERTFLFCFLHIYTIYIYISAMLYYII